MKAKMIAEPAIYWRGEQTLLYNMIATAAAAQADFFKLQLFNPDRLSGKFSAKKAFYANTQLNRTDLQQVVDKVRKYGMEMLFTINTPDKLELSRSTNVYNIKVASGQLCEKLIDSLNKDAWDKVFVSTGMLDDVSRLELIKHIQSAKEVIILHAVSLYPTYDNECNMSRLKTLMEYFGTSYHYGYSDHTLDDIPCLAAIVMGAEYVERHFMVENCFGPTANICCDGEDLQKLATLIRRMDCILGDGDLLMQKREHASWDHYKNRFLL